MSPRRSRWTPDWYGHGKVGTGGVLLGIPQAFVVVAEIGFSAVSAVVVSAAFPFAGQKFSGNGFVGAALVVEARVMVLALGHGVGPKSHAFLRVFT